MEYQENSEKLLTGIASIGQIESHILNIRGQKVMMDAHLAEIYGTTTSRLNEQVNRNISRFPEDFMFELSKEEKLDVIANCDILQKLKFSHVLPRVFTEHGAIMLASVLNSAIAIEASIHVVRAFFKMRSMLTQEKVIANLVSQVVVEVITETQKRGLFNFNGSPTPSTAIKDPSATTSTVKDSTSTNSISLTGSKLTKKQILEASQSYYQLIDIYSKKVILDALEFCKFHNSLTAKYLQISESTFYRLLLKYDLQNSKTNSGAD